MVDVNNDRGYIVTAAHVCHLSEAAEHSTQKIKVVLNSGTKEEREVPAEVLARVLGGERVLRRAAWAVLIVPWDAPSRRPSPPPSTHARRAPRAKQ